MQVLLQTQLKRELQPAMNLHLRKRLQIKHNPLQVHNQHFWQLIQQRLLSYLHGFLLTFLAIVVLYRLWGDKFFKTLLQCVDVLNLQRQVVKVLYL